MQRRALALSPVLSTHLAKIRVYPGALPRRRNDGGDSDRRALALAPHSATTHSPTNAIMIAENAFVFAFVYELSWLHSAHLRVHACCAIVSFTHTFILVLVPPPLVFIPRTYPHSDLCL